MANNYNLDSVQKLDFFSAVRKYPGMYIGSKDIDGLHHLAKEIISNPKLEDIVSDSAKESFELFVNNFKDLKNSFQELSNYDDLLDQCKIMDFKNLKKILDMGVENLVKDKIEYFEAIQEETKSMLDDSEFVKKFDNDKDLNTLKKFVEELEELFKDFEAVKNRILDRLSFLEYVKEEVEEKVKKQRAEGNATEEDDDDLDDEEFENRFFAEDDDEEDE